MPVNFTRLTFTVCPSEFASTDTGAFSGGLPVKILVATIVVLITDDIVVDVVPVTTVGEVPEIEVLHPANSNPADKTKMMTILRISLTPLLSVPRNGCGRDCSFLSTFVQQLKSNFAGLDKTISFYFHGLILRGSGW